MIKERHDVNSKGSFVAVDDTEIGVKWSGRRRRRKRKTKRRRGTRQDEKRNYKGCKSVKLGK